MLRGEGGGEFVRIIRQKVHIICTLKKAYHTHVKTVFGVYATRNDIRAIDTNFLEIGHRADATVHGRDNLSLK